MYSIEQAESALREKQFKDIQKELAYSTYLKDVELVTILGLPYKIIKEQSERCIKERKLLPNRYYPKHWSTIQNFTEWIQENHTELFDLFFVTDPDHLRQRMQYMFKDNTNLEESNYTDEYKVLRNEYQKWQQAFNNDNAQGIQKRKYYMARFLQGYDLTKFTMFDFFGTTTYSYEEMERFRQECIELQADFEKQPQKYFTEEVPMPDCAVSKVT